jgi:hypothetical protein
MMKPEAALPARSHDVDPIRPSIVQDRLSGREICGARKMHELDRSIPRDEVCQRHVDEKEERCCLRSIHRGPIRPIGTHRLPRGSLVAAAQVGVCNRKGVFKSDFAVERIDAA